MDDGPPSKPPAPVTGNTAKRPTLKTIAFMTGLGVTTVSKALNDAPDIGAATKQRVRMVAKQIGYRPNRAGVRLRTGRTNVISLILSTETEILGLSSHLIYGISERLSGTPYHLIVTPYDVHTDPLVPVRYIVETGSADAVIFSRTMPQDPRAIYLHEHGMPFATHGRTELDFQHPFYDFDIEKFGTLAVEALAARGRRRITLLPPPMYLTYAQLLMGAFRRTVSDLGLMDVPVRDVTIDDSRKEIKDEIRRILRSDHRPDGFICASPASAIYIISVAEGEGLKIGRDFDLVSKESYDILKQFRPEVLVVGEDFRTAGTGLADSVLKALAGAPPETLQVLEIPDEIH